MQAYMVGGAVRDRLLGLEPKDIDYVVVGSTPEEMEAAGYKQVGADFPVFLSPDGTEYALARTERKSGRGYNGFVTDANPTVTLEQDLERRDLTINAMAMSERTDELELFDPFNGQDDLANKVLRHVSPAFADDPVRVLRLARFHARYGERWKVAPETLAFARQMVEAGELAFLTRERVLAELEKALQEQSPHLFFETLRACGAMDVVFPEMADLNPKLLTWTLTAFPSQSGRFNWAKMTSLMLEPENFERRLNVTNHWRTFAKLFRTATSLGNTHPVDRLYLMDAYRQSGVWEALMHEARESGFNLDFLSDAYNATKHVSFNTLPEQARSSLSGKDIAEAILKQRKFAYDAHARVKA